MSNMNAVECLNVVFWSVLYLITLMPFDLNHLRDISIEAFCKSVCETWFLSIQILFWPCKGPNTISKDGNQGNGITKQWATSVFLQRRSMGDIRNHDETIWWQLSHCLDRHTNNTGNVFLQMSIHDYSFPSLARKWNNPSSSSFVTHHFLSSPGEDNNHFFCCFTMIITLRQVINTFEKQLWLFPSLRFQLLWSTEWLTRNSYIKTRQKKSSQRRQPSCPKCTFHCNELCCHFCKWGLSQFLKGCSCKLTNLDSFLT